MTQSLCYSMNYFKMLKTKITKENLGCYYLVLQMETKKIVQFLLQNVTMEKCVQKIECEIKTNIISKYHERLYISCMSF